MLLQTEQIPTITEKFNSWSYNFGMRLPEILVAILFMVVILILSRYVRKLTVSIYHRRSDNPAIATVMASFFSIVFVVFGIFIALDILGLNQTVTSLLAGAGILGLVLGLALQDTLSSAVAGIIMTQRKSYKVGDFVDSNEFTGTIVEINLRNTTIRQTTGVDVKIPNKLVLNNPLTNYSLTKERRVDITIGVAFQSEPDKVISISKSAIAESVTELNKQKDIEVFLTEFSANTIKVLIRYWINKYRQADFLQAQSEGIIAIKKAYDANGIIIPYPLQIIEIKKE